MFFVRGVLLACFVRSLIIFGPVLGLPICRCKSAFVSPSLVVVALPALGKHSFWSDELCVSCVRALVVPSLLLRLRLRLLLPRLVGLMFFAAFLRRTRIVILET